MELVNLVAIVLSLSAAFSYVNFRFIGLPTTIGVMSIALVISLGLILLGNLGVVEIRAYASTLLAGIDFNEALMDGMLSFLLFAGALHVSTEDLSDMKWTIAVLATIGVALSTLIVGTMTYYLLIVLGFDIQYLYCLLFGALISPTDPIAVMSTLKRAGISRSLETKIAGESLFNDGIGVVVFVVLLGIVQQPEQVSFSQVAVIFAKEAIGGLIFGFGLGVLGIWLLKSVDKLSGRDSGHPGAGHGRLHPGSQSAYVGADCRRSRRTPGRQPRSSPRNVDDHPATSGQFLGVAG